MGAILSRRRFCIDAQSACCNRSWKTWPGIENWIKYHHLYDYLETMKDLNVAWNWHNALMGLLLFPATTVYVDYLNYISDI